MVEINDVMNSDEKNNVARYSALLTNIQNYRLHLSWIITSQLGFVLAAIITLWSFFLQGYIRDGRPDSLFAAVAMSSILLGLWRWNTRTLDQDIARTYPDLVMLEGKLLNDPSIERTEFGTSLFLKRNVTNIEKLLDSDLPLNEQVKGLQQLVKGNKIGSRGHWEQDAVSILSLGIMVAIVYFYIREDFTWLFTILTIVGLAIMAFCLVAFQKEPCEDQVNKLVSTLRSGDKST